MSAKNVTKGNLMSHQLNYTLPIKQPMPTVPTTGTEVYPTPLLGPILESRSSSRTVQIQPHSTHNNPEIPRLLCL